MTRTTYYITLMLALTLAALTGMETWIYKKWDEAATEQKDNQMKLTYAQNMKGFTQVFLRRLAYEAQHDPALADMLKKDKVRVVVAGAGQPVDATHAEALPPTTAPLASPNLVPNGTPSNP